MQITLFSVTLALYVGVPLLWYGGVEFGLVRPIQTPEFKSALQSAGLILLILVCFLAGRVLRQLEHREEKRKADPKAQPIVE